MEPPDRTSRRKAEHIEVALSAATGQLNGRSGAGWDDIHLIHRSLPNMSLDAIDATTTFLGHGLQAPLMIAGMTGGHSDAMQINARLGAAAQRLGLPVGVGSQRAALQDPALEATYSVVRENAPSALVIGNLGMCQLVPQAGRPPFDVTHLRRAVDMVGAQGLAIHLNLVEELVQTEGDRNTSGLTEALRSVVENCPVPVVVKETGSGLSRETCRDLAALGVSAIDVGGAGGTDFARIESIRAERAGDERGARIGATFTGWGIPTAASVLEARSAAVPIIATGGVRSGLDAAKAIALGAHLVGLGRPALHAAIEGLDPLLRHLELFLEELRVAMLLCGAHRPADLRSTAPVLFGRTGEWARQRGLR